MAFVAVDGLSLKFANTATCTCLTRTLDNDTSVPTTTPCLKDDSKQSNLQTLYLEGSSTAELSVHLNLPPQYATFGGLVVMGKINRRSTENKPIYCLAVGDKCLERKSDGALEAASRDDDNSAQSFEMACPFCAPCTPAMQACGLCNALTDNASTVQVGSPAMQVAHTATCSCLTSDSSGSTLTPCAKYSSSQSAKQLFFTEGQNMALRRSEEQQHFRTPTFEGSVIAMRSVKEAWKVPMHLPMLTVGDKCLERKADGALEAASCDEGNSAQAFDATWIGPREYNLTGIYPCTPGLQACGLCSPDTDNAFAVMV